MKAILAMAGLLACRTAGAVEPNGSVSHEGALSAPLRTTAEALGQELPCQVPYELPASCPSRLRVTRRTCAVRMEGEAEGGTLAIDWGPWGERSAEELEGVQCLTMVGERGIIRGRNVEYVLDADTAGGGSPGVCLVRCRLLGAECRFEGRFTNAAGSFARGVIVEGSLDDFLGRESASRSLGYGSYRYDDYSSDGGSRSGSDDYPSDRSRPGERVWSTDNRSGTVVDENTVRLDDGSICWLSGDTAVTCN